MRLLIVVPARGGSKGLPGKNLRLVGGASLVGRAVHVAREFARQAALGRATILVDTDSPEIADEGRRWGAEVPFLRPAELALDTTPTVDSVLHAVDRLAAAGASHDAVLLLQPTSPLRTADDVAAVWRAFDPESRPSVIATVAAGHAPELALRATSDGALEWAFGAPGSDVRRQASGAAVYPSGLAYVSTIPLLRERRAFIVPGVTRGVLLPASRSVDVDTAEDLAVADALATREVGTRPFAVGSHRFEPGRCFVIAEAGVNHNGDVALAHRLVDVAADAGADAVKFQTFEPKLLASAAARKASYQVTNTGEDGGQLAMLEALVLPHAAHRELQAHAAERGLTFLSTAFDEGSADLLESLDVPAFKVPSGELTNHRLVRHLARKGRPLLMSTGMATLDEVADAVLVVREEGDPPLALFHCVTNYPAAPHECNLAAMDAMRGLFGVPVGWSDHTLGLDITLAAVARGAAVIEKHFTLDRHMPGPDHAASLEPPELEALMRGVRAVEAAVGDGVKRPAPSEVALVAAARRSLHAVRDLAPGHTLAPEDVAPMRPGDGLSPALERRLVGRRLLAGVGAGQMLRADDLE